MSSSTTPKQSSLGGQGVAAAALLVMAGFIGSRTLGLLRDMAISARFGTSGELDAYVAAFRIPDLIFNVLAGGALSSALIPTLRAYLERDEREAGWAMVRAVAVALLGGMLVCTALVWLAAPALVPALAPGWHVDRLRLTTDLVRLMLVTPLLFGASGIATAVLQAHQRFTTPAIAPTLYNAGIIAGALFLAGPGGMGVFGLATGVVIGALLHLGVQMPELALLGRLRGSIDLHHPGLRRVVLLMAPRLFGLAVVHLNFFVLTVLASFLPEGSLAALNFAWLLMMLPLGVFGMAISTAALPTLSGLAARGELEALGTAITQGLRAILFLSVPSAFGLIVLREPLIRTLFERGRFSSTSTDLVATALIFYCAGLAAHAALELITRGFYALQDTRTPALVGAGALLVNIPLSVALMQPLRHGGLALGISLATTIEALSLYLLLHRRVQALNGQATVWALLQGAAASLVMAGVLLLILPLLTPFFTGPFIVRAAMLGVLLGVGAGSYALTLWVLGVPEVRILPHVVAARVRPWLLRLRPSMH